MKPKLFPASETMRAEYHCVLEHHATTSRTNCSFFWSGGAIGERRGLRERERSDVLRALTDGSAAPWLRDGIAHGMRLPRRFQPLPEEIRQ